MINCDVLPLSGRSVWSAAYIASAIDSYALDHGSTVLPGAGGRPVAGVCVLASGIIPVVG